MKSNSNLYEILGVSSTSEQIVIEAAYRALMRQYQPKVASDPEAAKRVQRINAAYSTLSNPRKRSLYDASLRTEIGPAVQAPSPEASEPVTEAEPESRPSDDLNDQAYTESKYAQNFSWAILVPIVLVALVSIAVFNNLGSGTGDTNGSADSVLNDTANSTSVGNETQTKEPEPPPPLVLDQAIAFSNPANCVAAPALNRVFDDILPFTSTGDLETPRTASLGDLRLTPKLEDFVKASDRPGTIAKISSVRLPREAVWHGLKMSRLVSSYYSPPDTDATYSRSITFRATPDEVRSVLAAEGFSPPTQGNSSELTDDACGGAMYLLPVKGGSELRCSWGC